MKKKILLLTLLVLAFGCARGADQIQQQQSADAATQLTSSLLWSSIGGNAQSNNVVSGQLPQSIDPNFAAVNPPATGLQVYTSPVIYKGADDTIYVIALWANTATLKLVKYTYNSGSLTVDTSFDVRRSPSSNSGSEKAHQVVLSQEGEEIYVYVSHNDGVDKLTTSGETILQYGTNSNPAYGLLVNDGSLYVQTETEFTRYSLTNTFAENSFNYDGDSHHPTMAIPLVISGDHVFVAHTNKVFKVDAQTLIQSGSPKTITNEIKNMVAYNSGVIIASKKVDNITGWASTFDATKSSRKFTTIHYEQFGGNGTGHYPNDFSSRYDEGSTEDESSTSFKRSAIGDASYAAIIVNGSDYYVPGFYNTNNTAIAHGDNLPAPETAGFTKVSGSTLSAVFSNSTQVINDIKPGIFTVTKSTLLKSTRFAVLDTQTNQVFAVQNTNASFFDSAINTDKITDDTSGVSGGKWQWMALEIALSAGSGGIVVTITDPNKTAVTAALGNYNSQVILGNSGDAVPQPFANASLQIDSIAVGDKFIVAAGNDGKLYIID